MTRIALFILAIAVLSEAAWAKPASLGELYASCRAAIGVNGEQKPDWIEAIGNGSREHGLLRLGVSYGHCMGYIESALDGFSMLTRADGSPYFCLPADLQSLDVARNLVAGFDRMLMADWTPRLAVFMALGPYECRTRGMSVVTTDDVLDAPGRHQLRGFGEARRG